MGAEKLNLFTLNSYDYGFRRDSHQLLAWGHQDALPNIHCKLLEEEITGLIADAIKNRLNNHATPEKFDRYSINEEMPISVEGRTGKKRRRLDLVIVSGYSRPRPTYIFEAKRLKKNGFPIGLYLGEDGLQCFIKKVYASKYPEAAMVGYVQSDTASYWEAELLRSFKATSSRDLRVKRILEKVNVLPSMTDVWFSEHEREELDSITVYHIFLDCSVTSA
jgi:hypothetical protein